MNECSNDSLNECHENATCSNIPGSYSCSCDSGYNDDNGNGTICTGTLTQFIIHPFFSRMNSI